MAEIFSISFNPYTVIFFLSFLTSVNLILIILRKRYFVLSINFFLGLLTATGIMAIAQFLSSNAASKETFEFWNLWIFLALTLIPILELSFAICFVGKEEIVHKYWFMLICCSSFFLVLYHIWQTDLIEVNKYSEAVLAFWGYSVEPGEFLNFFTLYHLAYYLPAYFLMLRFYRNLKDRMKKRQTLLIIIGMLIPTVGGVTFQGVVPILFNTTAFPASVPLITIADLIITVAILRYGIQIFSPVTLASTVLQTIREAIVGFDTNYKIEYTNPAAQRLLGYQPDSLVGLPLKTFFANDAMYQQVVEKATSTPLLSEVVAREGEIITIDKTRVPVSWSVSRILEGAEVLGFVLVLANITPIKEYELELEKKVEERTAYLSAERNKLAVVLSGISDAIIAVDLDGSIVMFNQAAKRLTGYQEQEVLGKKISQVIQLFEQEEEILFSKYCPLDGSATQRSRFEKQGLKMQAYGKETYVNFLSEQIRDGAKVNLGCIVRMHDVTEEVHLEEMKLDFVSMAAHELRTPLTTIKGYLSVFMDENKGSLTALQNTFLQRIAVAAEQLQALIENLLVVSRIEKGKLPVQIAPLDWTSAVKEVVESLSQQAMVKQIDLRFIEPKGEVPKVMADKLKITEVLTNLLANALNYTNPAGSVQVSLERKAEKVVTHVVDTGQGIPADAMEHLFTKFFRVTGRLTAGVKGTGLGLYISKAIVDAHNGSIWATSTLGKGSAFSFSLPIET